VVSVVDTAKDAIDLGERITLPADATTPAAGSMLEPAALRPALALARREGKLFLLRVAADQVGATLVSPQRRLVLLTVPASGEPRRVVAGPAPSTATLAWSAVDPTAPRRVARAAARDAKRSVGRVNYLVLMEQGDGPQWQLYFKDGLRYVADQRGRHVHRVG
jgi:hypothetical protein